MRKLRTKMTVFLWFAMFVFVGFIFLSWGMQATRSRKLTPLERGIVGMVNGRPLSYRAYNNFVGHYREQGIEPFKCREFAFNTLIEEALLDDVFKERGLKLTDEKVIEIIKNSPPPEMLEDTLLQTNGKFDYQKYLAIISNPANIRWLRSYEAIIRSQVPRQLLYQEISSNVRPTTIDLIEGYMQGHLKLKLEYVLFEPDKFDASIEKIREYYDNHREEFKVSERPKLKYVRFPVIPTLRDEAFIKDEAQEIFERAKQGVSLDSLVIEYKCELSTIEKSVKGIHKPIKRDDGYHIIAMDKDLLLPIRPSDETVAGVEDRVRSFIEAAKSGFDEAVLAYELKVEEGYNIIEELNISFLNLKKSDKLIGPVEGQQCFYVLYTLGYQPAHIPDFSEVEEKVRDKYLNFLAKTKAQKLYQEVTRLPSVGQEGEKFRKLLSQKGWKVITTSLETLKDSKGEAFFLQASNIPEDDIGLAVTDKGYYLIHCLKRIEPSQEQIRTGIPDFQAQWMQEETQRLYTEWFNNLKASAKIEDYRYELH
ncbi:SurA N-terminal domain-containing protein [candidate division WOR-3 bacterium]|nr:SurA N-terminal domain-containing protein [candidate division WOR-3 bacterium]